jgi:hypothetical protein
MEKPSIQIKNVSFPNQMAADAEKESNEYGLKVGHAIQGEWFRRVGNDSCKYYSQYGEFHRLRLYSRGEQSIAKYKSELSHNGDLSYINLDWTPVPIIPKFVDILVNGIQDRLYKVKVEAQDIMSAEKKNLFQDMVEADMVAKDFLAQAKDQTGIDAFNVPQKELPETSEELSLYMQLKFKPSVEIAEEVALNTILLQNDYQDTLKPAVDKDIAIIGIGAAKHEFNPSTGLELSYVDPASLVYSYTEKKDFSDCYYFGEVKQVHITELLKIKPDLTDEDIKEITSTAGAWQNHFPIVKSFNDDSFGGEMVSILFFNYKTSKRFAYKRKFLKNGGERVIKKSDTFRPNVGEDDSFGVVESIKDVWYEGVLVLGSNKLLKWGLLKNMVRPDAATQKALPNYVVCAPNMYNGVIESLVRRMIPFADQIQLTHLKLQQVMSRVVPDGVFIDADGLNEVDLGNGAAYNPEEALKLYFQTGSVIGRSNTMEGEFNNARIPIQELSTNSGQSKMQALISVYNYNLNMIRDVTGMNEARDGSMPNSDALVGVQKLAALNSNIATRHILEGGLLITKRLCQCISLRIADILKYADFRDEFAMQIGNYNLAILDDIKNLYLHSFGVFIELAPDEEEKQLVEQNIQMALSRDQIDLEDAIDIRTINNLKLANELLKVKRRKKMEAAQKSQEMQMQMQMQSNIQSQQAAAEGKQAQIQAESQGKISVITAQAQVDMQKLELEVEKKKELMQMEFDYNMQLKGIETDNLKSREKAKEDAKDERVKKQATAQSKLIEQRQNNLPPVDFESSGNDALGDFNLEAFEPR